MAPKITSTPDAESEVEVREWGNDEVVIFEDRDKWVQFSEDDIVDVSDWK